MGVLPLLGRSAHQCQGAAAYRHLWGQEMSGKHIRSLCDNAAVVAIINKCTSTHPLAMHLLRCLYFICAKFSITLSAQHLAGYKNKAADALSRGNVKSFFQEVPYASTSPSPVSSDLVGVLVSRRPNWLSSEWSGAFKDCL